MKRILLVAMIAVVLFAPSTAWAAGKVINPITATSRIMDSIDSLQVALQELMWSAPPETTVVVDTTSFDDGPPLGCDILDTLVVSVDSFYVCTDSVFTREVIGLDSLARALQAISITSEDPEVDTLLMRATAQLIALNAYVLKDTVNSDSISVRVDSLRAALLRVELEVKRPDRSLEYEFTTKVTNNTATVAPPFRSAIIGYSAVMWTADDGPVQMVPWLGGVRLDTLVYPYTSLDVGAQGGILPPFEYRPMESDSVTFKWLGNMSRFKFVWIGVAN